jgi:RNA polymerase sigma factor (sigma-70 family)
MATAQSIPVFRHLCRLVGAEHTARLPDGQLLERFALHSEEAAFTALVRRHGPLVLGVCRRILHNWHDAEDAFQATFLVLARKARSIAKQESVGSWLYQVAYRTALRARARSASRLRRERQATLPTVADPLAEVTGRELLGVLDEELHQLPERHRAPLVLCCLQGQTRDEAARQLGWSLRALKHRLEQGRELLRSRLARRGLTLPGALLAAGLAQGTARAAVSSKLAGTTVRAVLDTLSGSVFGPAADLASQVLRGMAVTKFKLTAALLFAIGAVVLGAGVLLRQAPALAGGGAGTPKNGAKAPTKPAAKNAGPGRSAAGETVTVTGRVLDAGGQPLPGARACLMGLPKGGTRSSLQLLEQKNLGRARADAGGRFRLVVPRKALAPYEQTYILAGAAGHGLLWKEVKPAGRPAEAIIQLPEEKTIRGRLRDLQGLPVAGVEVQVNWLGSSGPHHLGDTRLGALPKGSAPLWPEPIITGKDGKFVLRGLNPAYHGYLHIQSDRFAPSYAEIKPGAGKKVQTVNLVLAPAQLIEGVITAKDTGKPLAQVRMSVNSDQNAEAPEAMGPGVSGRTDARGRFRLNPPRGKMFTVRAEPTESGPYLRAKTSFKWSQGAIRREVKLALDRGVIIRGKVTEQASGKPVAGAVIRDTIGLWINPTVSTRADGTFQIAVRPGRGHLLVKGPGNDYIPMELTFDELEGRKPTGGRFYPDAVVSFDLKPGQDKQVAVQLRRGVTVSGRLVGPDGKPPREAVLLCWNQVPQHAPTWFAAGVRVVNGRFALRGCDPLKTYTVHFLDARNESGATVRLSAKKAGGKPVTVRLGPCGSAEVRFLAKPGKPVSNFRPIFYMIARPGSGQPGQGLSPDQDFVANVDHVHYPTGTSPVDAQGRCKFPALIPGATYRVINNNFRGVMDFTVKPGEKRKLTDIVIGNQ